MKKNKVRLEDLPTYEIVCEEDGTQGIRMVSLVKDPAIEVKGMYFSAEELETEKRYEFKTVGDKQIIVGPAMIPNKKILRRDQNDNLYYVYFTPQTIKMMVDKFNKENNNKSINVDHSNKMVDGFIQQNWIVEDPTYDKSRYYGFNLPVGTWFIEVKIEDEDFWMNDVKDDGKYGFSIEGMMGQELVEMESDINKLIDDLTDDEIIKMFGDILDIDTNKFVVEPKAGETEEEFISRCIGEEINSGYEKDQAAAICYTKWDNKSMESEVKFAETYNDYPKSASENAKKALRWAEKNGWGSCGTPVGKIRANQLANNESISRETIARMAAFERHRQNSQKPLGDGCGRLMWLAWGGDEGVAWAQRKLQQIDKEQKMATIKKVSFDFDGTLSRKDIQEKAKKMVDEGYEVYVVTKRSPDKEVKDIAYECGIKLGNVYFTSGEPKWKTLLELGIEEHYDNSEEEAKSIRENTKVKVNIV
jgi:hypothetical protein